jgi:DNA-binding NtrC family response regulator/tetratricopeptide (TPR) repeat protein
LETHLEANPESEPDALLLSATALTRIAQESGDLADALKWVSVADKKRVSEASHYAAATFLVTSTVGCFRTGNLEGAEQAALSAVSRAESSDNDALKADSLGALANVSRLKGHLEEAQRIYARAVTLYWRAGDRNGLARALLNRAALLNRLGHLNDSYETFSEARKAAQSVGRTATALRARLGMGWVDVRRGLFEDARKTLLPAWREARRLHLPREEALALEYLGEGFILSGRLPQARRALSRCRRLALRIAPKGDVSIECALREALLALAEDRVHDAIRIAGETTNEAKEQGMGWEAAQGERILGTALARADRHDAARRVLADADARFREMGEVFERRITSLWLRKLGETPSEAGPTDKEAESHWMTHPLLVPAPDPGISTHLQDKDVQTGPKQSERVADRTRTSAQRGPALGIHSVWKDLGLVTQTPSLAKTLQRAETLAGNGLALLVLGETGTGKDLLARGLHKLSGCEGPFLAFNCAACQPELAVAELFGAVQGAYTGAHKDRKGLLASADKGTLFLDEIADLDVKAQGALLRFLDSGEVRPVGGTKSIVVRTRVIAATHRPLQEMVRSGEFRRDLYFRLAGSILELPPLRERRGDLKPLFRFLWERAQGSEAGLDVVLREDVLDALGRRSWPGNVREFAHDVHMAAVLSQQEGPAAARRHLIEATGSVFEDSSLPTTRAERPTREDVTRALDDSAGRVREAARRLGVSRAQAYRLVKDYDLKPRRRP